MKNNFSLFASSFLILSFLLIASTKTAFSRMDSSVSMVAAAAAQKPLSAQKSLHYVFMGVPSRLIIRGGYLVMASSLGAMGLFDVSNGRLIQVLGNALGFSPKISVADDGVLLLTRFGTVAKFR